MPRHPDPQTHVLYELHRRWLVEVVPSEGTLLEPSGRRIWTSEQIEALARLIEPLEKGKGVLDALQVELEGGPPELVQLLAEAYLVHVLPIVKAIGGRKKVATVEAILSWTPEPATVPPEWKAAVQHGIANPGMFANAYPGISLRWILQFALAWAALSDDGRAAHLDDPWAFRTLAESIDVDSANGARLVTLHLAHPETFERVLAEDHKKLISQRFDQLAGDETDIDRRLLVIRRGLDVEAGEEIDLYLGDFKWRWQRSEEWPALLHWVEQVRALPQFDEWERDYKLELAERLRTAREQMRAGTAVWPDTLRKALARANLVDFYTIDTFSTWVAANPTEASAALRGLWDGEDAPWRRLDRFVDLVPDEVLATPGKRRNMGSVLLMAEDPAARPPIKVTLLKEAFHLAGWPEDDKDLTDGEVYRRALYLFEELAHDGADWPVPLRDPLDAQSAVWTVLRLEDRPEQWTDAEWRDFLAYRGEEVEPLVPGSGGKASPTQGSEGGGDGVDHLAAAATDLHVKRDDLEEIVDLLDDKGQAVLYGPPGTGKTYLALRLARAIAEGDESRVSLVQFHPATTYEDFIEGLRPRLTDAGQVTYEVVPGPLVRMAEQARHDPDHTHVLVIDEINRANLPKVFGELLFLLEYRKEKAYTLHRPDEPFGLPPNLQILATMNTADRSIALIDAAMRRRFHFVPFFPHQGMMRGLLGRWLDDRGGRAGVARLLDAVNAELLDDLGDHLLLGPAHFMKSDLSDTALERIWTYNVFPLIEEQYWGDREAIERWRWPAVRRRFAEALGSPAPVEDDDPAELGEPGDLDDGPVDEPSEP